MFGAIIKTTNSSFQKGMTFCRSIYVKKVMKLLALIFEQSSYREVFIYYNTSTCINQYSHENILLLSWLRGFIFQKLLLA